ncbi:MerR family transcriptional regulator [Mangrovihabitans endophyticus]|uniref:HTH merR-type domain-containing protein n=1 Tax=Mangrovihabitans endophyticus TaxID=1751298 RepID=A0A8J3C8U4_9ACTN|nr:MerR family transcriptional regulator [Mangrovihabitans endophyticus]GGL19325.1 hypothetical protein GCM10012284_62310 [Mangrovihabitans endophyticus]
MWTMDELVERVGDALAGEYPGAPNGRVRDLPDRRAIRWYTTIGLVDRPLGMRGRSALYDTRHLRQLVAIKRRQAAGASLAQIQAELAGATDEELAAIARMPDGSPRSAPPESGAPAAPAAPRARFWAQPPTPGPAGEPVSGEPVSGAAPTAGGPLGGVGLPGGAILVLPGVPTDDDRAAIVAATRPLIDLLARRGLLDADKLDTDGGSPS